jgi:hypothetical protein
VWESDSLNAQAFRLGPAAHVSDLWRLAAHRDIGPEGLALAIAHEIGHHKGGAPRAAITTGSAPIAGPMNGPAPACPRSFGKQRRPMSPVRARPAILQRSPISPHRRGAALRRGAAVPRLSARFFGATGGIALRRCESVALGYGCKPSDPP